MSPFNTVESRRIYEGRVVNLRVDTLDVGDGQTVQREIVEHAGAVVMAAVDGEGRVLLSGNTATPSARGCWSCPRAPWSPTRTPRRPP